MLLTACPGIRLERCVQPKAFQMLITVMTNLVAIGIGLAVIVSVTPNCRQVWCLLFGVEGTSWKICPANSFGLIGQFT